MRTNTNAKTEYMSPKLDMYEIIVEAPIASSVGGADSNDIGVEDAGIDNWGTL